MLSLCFLSLNLWLAFAVVANPLPSAVNYVRTVGLPVCTVFGAITLITRVRLLQNLANTCHLNVVLQSLIHVKPFRDKVLQYQSKEDCRELNSRPLVAETIADLVSAAITYDDSSKSQNRILGGVQLSQRLRSVVNHLELDPLSQEDAHEVMLRLLDKTDTLGIFTGDSVVLSTYEEDKAGGIPREEVFVDVGIDVADRSNRGGSVLTGLKNALFGEEVIATPTSPSKRLTRKHSVLKWPSALFLHLKRFQYDSKLQTVQKVLLEYSFDLACMKSSSYTGK
jgi:ubiquitin C-terminal hydrolase